MTISCAVVGAGGPSGALVVDLLLKEKIKTVAVVRSPDKYADRWPKEDKNFSLVQGDVTDRASLDSALAGCTHVVFAASGKFYFSANSVDLQGVRNTADAATKGSHVILISSALTSPQNRFNPIRILLNNIRWGLMDSKFAGEEALRNDKRIRHTVLRPAGLTNDVAGTAKLLIRQGDNLRNPGRISRADLASVVLAAIKNPNSQQKTVEVASDNTIKPKPDDLDHLFDDAKALDG